MTNEFLRPIFKDLHVVEFASALAGPLAGTFFQELGARVTKVERHSGDVTRHWRSANESEDTEHSYYYCAANGNKKSVRLNLRNDRKALAALIESADIIVTNFTKAKARELQLDHQALSQFNDHIILANVIGFLGDPDRPAFDLLLQAECGLLSFTGFKDHWPVRVPLPIVDILCAHQLKEAILCALLKRFATGEGCEIQLSLYDSILSALTHVASNYLMSGSIAKPTGTKHPNIAPYGDIFLTRDRQYLMLAIGTDEQFTRLCACMHCEPWSLDMRFASNRMRVINRAVLCEFLAEEFIKSDLTYWVQCLRDHQIPAGPIRTINQVLSSSEAAHNIISEKMPDGTISKRMRQAVFIAE